MDHLPRSTVKSVLTLPHFLDYLVRPLILLVQRVFEHTANALISYVQNQANNLRRLTQNSPSLHYVFLAEFRSCGIFAELESALDVAEVVVLEFQVTRNRFTNLLVADVGACLVCSSLAT